MRLYELSRFSVFTDIIFGLHSSRELGSECKRLGATRVIVITDAVVAGMLGEAFNSLKSHDIPYVVFDQAPSDPTDEDIRKAVAFLKENECDVVVSAGGGSAMCTGKGSALMATNDGRICDYKGRDKYETPPLPCIAMPTTAGSGSEVSKATIITDEKTRMKTTITGLNNAPRVAILDPLLLNTVPRHQAICSGADALTHAVEALCSRHATPLTDGIALTAIEMISHNFKRSVLGDDLDAKGEMLFASSIANIACGNAGLGLSHGLTASLTYLMDTRDYPFVAYGDFHTILLPHVIEFNLPVAEAKLTMMARTLGMGEDSSQRELALKSTEWVKELFACLGAKSKLPWKDIPTNEMEEVVKVTLPLAQTKANPRRASELEIISVIQKALNGWETGQGGWQIN